MAKVAIHCYGCTAVVDVDERLPAEGLRIARWCTDGGETFCPACAKKKRLSDPWHADAPWADYGARLGGAVVADAPESVPAGRAIDDPQTRAALARYWHRGCLWFAAGTALLIAASVFAEINAHKANELLRTGIRTPGVVQSYAAEREGDEMQVRYVAQGAIRTAWITTSEDERPYLGEKSRSSMTRRIPPGPARRKTRTRATSRREQPSTASSSA